MDKQTLFLAIIVRIDRFEHSIRKNIVYKMSSKSVIDQIELIPLSNDSTFHHIQLLTAAEAIGLHAYVTYSPELGTPIGVIF